MHKYDNENMFNILNESFEEDGVWELFYLYKYLVKKRKVSTFFEKIKNIPKYTDAEILREYVKAETHDINMEYLYGISEISKIIEVRRFLEDIDMKSRYFETSLSIYTEMAKGHMISTNVLYEIRRFLKYGFSMEMLWILKQFKKVNYYGCNDWKIVDIILDKCINGIILNERQIIDLIERYRKADKKTKQDILFSSYLIEELV